MPFLLAGRTLRPPNAPAQSLPLGQQNHLRLSHDGDELAVLARDARGPHRGPLADMDRRRLAGDGGTFLRAPMKLVLLSMVVVLAPRGMLSTAPMAPSASAKAMIAPPCMIWPAVHRSGLTPSRATTLSGSAADDFHAHQGRKRLVRQDPLADVHDIPFSAIIRWRYSGTMTSDTPTVRFPCR